MKHSHIISAALFASLAHISFCAEKPTWSLYKTFEHDQAVNSAYPIRADDENFLITCTGNTTNVFNIGTTKKTNSFSHDNFVDSADILPEQNLLALSSGDRIHFINTSEEKIASFPSNRLISPNHFNSTKQLIATADSEKIEIFDIETKRSIASFGCGFVNDVSFHPTRNIVVAVTPLQHDNLARLHMVAFENQKQESKSVLFNEPLYSVCMSKMGKLLAVGKTNSIDIFDTPEELTIKTTITSLAGNVDSVCFDPSERFLAALCGKKLHIFDVETGIETFSTNHSDNALLAVQIQCFDESGTLLIVRYRSKVDVYELNK